MKEQLEQKELGSLQKQAEPLEYLYLYFTYLAITCCSSLSIRPLHARRCCAPLTLHGRAPVCKQDLLHEHGGESASSLVAARVRAVACKKYPCADARRDAARKSSTATARRAGTADGRIAADTYDAIRSPRMLRHAVHLVAGGVGRLRSRRRDDSTLLADCAAAGAVDDRGVERQLRASGRTRMDASQHIDVSCRSLPLRL